MEIYRVCISGIYGNEDEVYFINLNDAIKHYNGLIELKKRDETTLDDKGCAEEGLMEKNFSNIYIPSLDNKKTCKTLRGVFWCYGIETNDENGWDFSSNVAEIILEEIHVI